MNPMKPSLTPVLLVVVFFSVAANAQPKLVIPQPEFDFGFVPQSAKVSHEFWLYSEGTETLQILKVNPG